MITLHTRLPCICNQKDCPRHFDTLQGRYHEIQETLNIDNETLLKFSRKFLTKLCNKIKEAKKDDLFEITLSLDSAEVVKELFEFGISVYNMLTLDEEQTKETSNARNN